MSVVIKHPDGTVSWEPKNGDYYDVTGVDRDGKRFFSTHNSWKWANGINLWRGSKWLVRDGKRHLILRVYN